MNSSEFIFDFGELQFEHSDKKLMKFIIPIRHLINCKELHEQHITRTYVLESLAAQAYPHKGRISATFS